MSARPQSRGGGGSGGAASIFEELFQQIAAEPEVNTAWLSPVPKVDAPAHGCGAGAVGAFDVVVQSTQRDFARVAKTKLLTELRMTLASGPGGASGGDHGVVGVAFERRSLCPQPLGDDVQGLVVSPSGEWRSVLRARMDSTSGKKKTEFEFWSRGALACVVDVTDLHGKVMLDNDQFGHLAWSPCERFVAYSAQRVTSKEEKEAAGYNK